MNSYYIGLISGTSADAINGCLIKINDDSSVQLIDHHQVNYPAAIQKTIQDFLRLKTHDIHAMHCLDLEIGQLFAQCTVALKERNPQINIRAIGSHGQTIRHVPESGYTVQIGNGAVIAQQTGITCINQFRTTDMALGGQGAPFAPAFHQAVFASDDETRCIINIGGISNISYLPKDNKNTTGFDCGPGNTLLDQWIQRHLNKDFDESGQWGRSGKIDPALVSLLMSDAYIDAPLPKSTGPEHFNLAWLDQKITLLPHPISAVDVQASLTQFTAMSISRNIERYCPNTQAIYLCGGGVYNVYLKELLALHCKHAIGSTQELGIDPNWVEACLFAWMASLTMDGVKAPLKHVTGASYNAIAGCIWPV